MAALSNFNSSIFCSSSSFFASRSRLAGSFAACCADPSRTSVIVESSRPSPVSVDASRTGSFLPGVLEDRMLGSQPLFAIRKKSAVFFAAY